VALSLFGQVVPFLLLGKAAQMTTSADMALMMGASPIFVFLAARFVRSGDRWTLLAALGLALGFAGVGLALWSPTTPTATAAHPAEGRALALLAAIDAAFGARPSMATILAAPPAPILAMVALGVFNTALAYFAYFRLVASEGPTFASLNNYIVPLIGVMGGALALGEPVALAAWVGLALVLAGVALTGRSLRAAR
jgi:drug/metabolite transporter (DMT)-like permease